MTSTTAPAATTPRGRKVGEGGEAEVFELPTRPGEVLKLYWAEQSDQARAEKLAYMVDHAPADPGGAGWTCIAWPTGLEVDVPQRRHGFRMPRIDTASSATLFQVYTPRERMKTAPSFTWQYLLRTAANLSRVVAALHAAGYVIGDLNESNFLVSHRALVAAVDCDSFQVRDTDRGRVYRCTVAKWERVAPELQGRNLHQVNLTEHADRFALAILVFQLLMEGVHPFQGTTDGGEPVSLEERIRRRAFPYAKRSRVRPPRHALALETLPPPLVRMMRRAFEAGARKPHLRPSADEWCAALTAAESALSRCAVNANHCYSAHLRRCPWCERVARGYPDTFSRATPRKAAPPAPMTRQPAAVTTPAPAAVAARKARPAATAQLRTAQARWQQTRSGQRLCRAAATAIAVLRRQLPIPLAALASAIGLVVPTLAATAALSLVLWLEVGAAGGRARRRMRHRRDRTGPVRRAVRTASAHAAAARESALPALGRLTRLAAWGGAGLLLCLLMVGWQLSTDGQGPGQSLTGAATALLAESVGRCVSSALLAGAVFDALRRAQAGQPDLPRRADAAVRRILHVKPRWLLACYAGALVLLPLTALHAPTTYLPYDDRAAGLDAVLGWIPLVA